MSLVGCPGQFVARVHCRKCGRSVQLDPRRIPPAPPAPLTERDRQRFWCMSVGFSRATLSGADLYSAFGDDAYSSWDMLSSIGPIAGFFGLGQWDLSPVITTAGVLSFTTSIVAVPGSFQAGIAVPAPGTLGLFSLALLEMAVTRAAKRARG